MPLTKAILIPLSDAQMAERGRELATACKDLEEAEADKKESAAAAKARIDACEGAIGRLANAIRSGKEEREVEIEQIPDYKAGLWITKRLDTGEVIEQEPMSDADVQAHLFTDRELAGAGLEDPGPLPVSEGGEDPAAIADAPPIESAVQEPDDAPPGEPADPLEAIADEMHAGAPTPKSFPCAVCHADVEASTGLLAELQVALTACPHCGAPALDAFGAP